MGVKLNSLVAALDIFDGDVLDTIRELNGNQSEAYQLPVESETRPGKP